MFGEVDWNGGKQKEAWERGPKVREQGWWLWVLGYFLLSIAEYPSRSGLNSRDFSSPLTKQEVLEEGGVVAESVLSTA